MSGLVGGIAAWWAVTYLVQPNPGTEIQALRARVERLDSGIGSLQGDHQALAQLSSRVEALQQAPPAPAADADLAARVEALEAARPAAAGQAEAGPDLAAVTSRLDALEQIAGAAQGSAESTDSEDLHTRLTALEGQVASLATDIAGTGDARVGDAASLEALQSRLGAIESRLPDAAAATARIDALSGRVDALEPAAAKLTQVAGEVGDVKDHLDGLATRVEALQGDVQGLQSQVAEAESKVAATQSKIAETQNRVAETQTRAAAADDRRGQAAALALLTSQIDAALGQGEAYEAPLRSLAALGDQDEVVGQAAAELAPGAASGVPDLAALRQSFKAVAGEIVQRERAPEGDSLLDQAASNLLRLVTVRPVGADVEGEGAAARVARAEADLDRGDLPGAVAEVEALEGPAAEAAAGWLADARRHLQASAALTGLRAHVTALLAPGN